MKSAAASGDPHEFAVTSLVHVLGAEVAAAVMSSVLAEVGIRRITNPHELLAFGRALQTRGGFEGATGAMLAVEALLRGASPLP